MPPITRRRLLYLGALSGVLAATSTVATADAAPASRVAGRVVDGRTGRPLAGARVHWVLPDKGYSGVLAVGQDGRYWLSDAPAGAHGLAVFAPGYTAPYPDSFVLAGGAVVDRPFRLKAGPLVPTEHSDVIAAAARRHDLPPSVVAAVIAVESRFDPRAVSKSGAKGLMQLMDRTAAGLGVTDSFDPAQNVEAGARYLAQMARRFPKVELALAAYHAGPTAVARAGGKAPNETTRRYIAKVLAAEAVLRAAET